MLGTSHKHSIISALIFLSITIFTSFSNEDQDSDTAHMDNKVAYYVDMALNDFISLFKTEMPEFFFIPTIQSINLPNYTIKGSVIPLANIKMDHFNVTLDGLSTIRDSMITVRLNDELLTLKLVFQNWTLGGQYVASGDVASILPVYGKGPFHINCTEVVWGSDAKLTKRNNEDKLIIENITTTLTAAKVYARYEGLYGGGKLGKFAEDISSLFSVSIFNKTKTHVANPFGNILRSFLNRKLEETTIQRIISINSTFD